MTAGGTATPDPVRYGVIGTGMMGIEHIENIRAIDGAIITAIADTNTDSIATGHAAAGHDVAVFTDHRDLLASGLCDAIVIVTPNLTHVDVLGDVLATDLHVLVEKPLCTTVEDCLRIIELSERRPADAITWVGLEYRYMPPAAELVRLVHEGVVGTPRMVAMREHRFPFLVKVDHWNRFSQNTGGTLVEKTCHFFDLMNLILQERPVRVMASGAQDVNHLDEEYDEGVPDILDNAFVIVDYPSGARALLDLCMFAEATHNQEEISVVGDRGKVEALIPENVIRVGVRGDHWIGGVDSHVVHDDRVAHEGLHHGSSYLEHLDFIEAIRGGRPPRVTLIDGLWSVAAGRAAHLSIELGRPVELSELLPAEYFDTTSTTAPTTEESNA
ncbi:MAG: Gfo/Idh/MocA family oxidoreductase [Ilumatobacter sp.]|uniref:Gfo/Idh/MocA family protein n=1 Tax=Ilumatobacter sp. TaxID=1967498 RepID=UPI0032984EC0